MRPRNDQRHSFSPPFFPSFFLFFLFLSRLLPLRCRRGLSEWEGRLKRPGVQGNTGERVFHPHSFRVLSHVGLFFLSFSPLFLPLLLLRKQQIEGPLSSESGVLGAITLRAYDPECSSSFSRFPRVFHSSFVSLSFLFLFFRAGEIEEDVDRSFRRFERNVLSH